jgi:hypothetical protein
MGNRDFKLLYPGKATCDFHLHQVLYLDRSSTGQHNFITRKSAVKCDKWCLIIKHPKASRDVPLFSYATALPGADMQLRLRSLATSLSSLHRMAHYDVSARLSPWRARPPFGEGGRRGGSLT